jgi:hypothetical protein
MLKQDNVSKLRNIMGGGGEELEYNEMKQYETDL